ncbi:hypothetical protein D9758_011947 [Tetrapyrgos nigripes]|uniref:Retroviral polymerase SH3-like domain-containing protein n=1 Tax=Tetrapyrgos nigripes TaxID=182062 RepID=A0A8H5D250_9AGAR|nr:hypothetical protein D9758_011947 [Tetrapyrgos nigripes]
MKHSIEHEFTAPYTSPSNGVAECRIGVLLEGTRAALFNSGLPPSWWGHATMSVAYVQNIFLNASGNVPEELWTSQRQNVSYLIPFGSISFVHIPEKSGQKKLDARGFKAQMVGYAGRKVYVVKEWGSNAVYHTSDVVWEKSNGHWVSEVKGKDEDLEFLTLKTLDDANWNPNQTAAKYNRDQVTSLNPLSPS